MHRSEIAEYLSETELSLVDTEQETHSDLDSSEQRQDDLFHDKFNGELNQKVKSVSFGCLPDDSDNSVYNRCWQRAEHYVQKCIKEHDDATTDISNEDEDEISYEKVIEDYQGVSARSQKNDLKDRSDTELSQLTQSSSDESKTYSQVYSEIYEESKARQKKAEKIRREYHANTDSRTRRWVENIGRSDNEDYTTEASDRSDKDSMENAFDYETLIKEQLEVIAQYQNDPLGSFRSRIEEYMCELQELQNVKAKLTMNPIQSEELAQESQPSDRSNHSNVIIKSYAQTLEFESNSSRNIIHKSDVEDKDSNMDSTEILQFEHCKVYHIRQYDKNKTNKALSKSLKAKEILTNDCQASPNKNKLEERTLDQCKETYFEQIKEQKSDVSIQSVELEAQNCHQDCMSQSKTSDQCESSDELNVDEMTRQNSESEDEKSFSKQIEFLEPPITRRSIKTSETRSNDSHKSLHLPTSSSQLSRIRSSHAESSDSSDNYYLSSKSSCLTSSSSKNSTKISLKARSVIKATKKYEDRGCSPIKITSRYPDNPGETDEELDYDGYKEELPESYNSSKTELRQQSSQASITSEDKCSQYPSENELEESVRSKKSLTYLRVCDLDKALLKKPTNFKGNAIMFDNEDELLDISLTDDELQMRAKIKAAVLSNRKKDCSSGNSSYNSSMDRSSIWSISSYEPSVRFHRRIHIEEDDDHSILDTDGPMTYKKHVSRLAERALRTCTNYYNESIKLKPELDQQLNDKVQMLYNSEMQFNRFEKQKKQEDSLHDFNKRLQRQLKGIPPRLK